jgi:CubicO group peptidase (beta-lactamase class C family)
VKSSIPHISQTCSVFLACTCLIAACENSDVPAEVEDTDLQSGVSDVAPLPLEVHGEGYNFEFVRSSVATYLDENPLVSGLGLAIVHRVDGLVYEAAFGEFAVDDVPMIASLSKTVTVDVIMTLVDDGLIDLDIEIADYLDWGDHHAGVTMRSLLSMQSGLPALGNSNHDCMFDPAASLRACGRAIYQNDGKSVPPYSAFLYGGGAWQLAGAVAEVVSSKSWRELFEIRIADPCGLRRTGYSNLLDPSVKFTNYPIYNGNPGTIPSSTNPNMEGGMYSTLNDQAKLLAMHLAGGMCGDVRVLQGESVAAMTTGQLHNGDELPSIYVNAIDYGMGWWLYIEDRESVFNGGAYGSATWMVSDGDYAVVMLKTGRNRDAESFMRALYVDIDDALRAGGLE